MVENYGMQIVLACWDILLESSGFILFGFFIAGLLKAFIPGDIVARHLGKSKFSNILKASAFGVPLPLCSCGVLPAAAGLKEQGASKGATSSFLISTPETGVDSIAVTWALLDPFMTVIRPLSALLTAIVTGVLVNVFDREEKEEKKPVIMKTEAAMFTMAPIAPAVSSSCDSGCGCEEKINEDQTLYEKLTFGMKFAFGDLFKDIAKWFVLGILLAGAITTFLPKEMIGLYLGDGILSMIVVLAIAIPLYVCATASTPIAAALALKGLSPGAALVFLLAGPATNAASLTVISKILGKKATGIYLGSIIFCSLILGLITNKIYGMTGLDITTWINTETHGGHGIISIVFAVVLICLIVFNSIERKPSHDVVETKHSHEGHDCAQ